MAQDSQGKIPEEVLKELRELTGATTDAEALEIALELARRDVAEKPRPS